MQQIIIEQTYRLLVSYNEQPEQPLLKNTYSSADAKEWAMTFADAYARANYVVERRDDGFHATKPGRLDVRVRIVEAEEVAA